MLDSAYTKALETKGAWLKWAKKEGLSVWTRMDEEWLKQNPSVTERDIESGQRSYASILPLYTYCLEESDTFFMNNAFCELVDHARISVPGDLKFSSSWMLAKQGWLWLQQPVEVPQINAFPKSELGGLSVKIRAIGWVHVPEGTKYGTTGQVTGPNAYEFLCYQSFDDYDFGKTYVGFGCWSYFLLQDGYPLDHRIKTFEDSADHLAGKYVDSEQANSHHEIRWIYSAFYLMAQKLAIQIDHSPDRHTRKRAERAQITIPNAIKVISLRKLEAARKIALTRNEPIEWHWTWAVRGHWRNHYCPSTKTHKQVFVESYIKGPAGKPLKPMSQKLFVAQR